MRHSRLLRVHISWTAHAGNLKGEGFTIDNWSRKSHHLHNEIMTMRNDWSPGSFWLRLCNFEQVLLDAIDPGIIGLLSKGHHEFLDHVAMLLCCLVLCLLNLLQQMKVAFH